MHDPFFQNSPPPIDAYFEYPSQPPPYAVGAPGVEEGSSTLGKVAAAAVLAIGLVGLYLIFEQADTGLRKERKRYQKTAFKVLEAEAKRRSNRAASAAGDAIESYVSRRLGSRSAPKHVNVEVLRETPL